MMAQKARRRPPCVPQALRDYCGFFKILLFFNIFNNLFNFILPDPLELE